MMVTLAILTVLAGITLTAVETLRPKADTATFASQVTTALANARYQATSEGQYVFFRWIPRGLDTSTPPFAGFLVCASPRSDYRPPASYDPADPCGPCPGGSQCAQLIERGEIPPATQEAPGTAFTTVTKLPAAFRNAVDLATVATGCSFCTGAGQPGWIRFLPRGEVELPSTSVPTGGALVFKADYAQEATREVRAVVVTAPYGLVRSFADG